MNTLVNSNNPVVWLFELKITRKGWLVLVAKGSESNINLHYQTKLKIRIFSQSQKQFLGVWRYWRPQSIPIQFSNSNAESCVLLSVMESTGQYTLLSPKTS